MNRAKNRCKDCDACKNIYDKGQFMFWIRCNHYYCVVFEKLIEDVNGFCENWQKKKPSYGLSVQRFDDVIKDIEWLINYIGDE